MARLFRYIASTDIRERLLLAFLGLTLLSIWLGILLDFWLLWGIPVLVLVSFLGIVDFQKLFFLLLALIPLSTELYLPNGFATDFPTEPLMVGLMLVTVLWLLQKLPSLDMSFLRHPLSLFLVLHLCWIFVTMLASEMWMVSLKFFLAKLWYVIVFYVLAHHVFCRRENIRWFFWLVFGSLLLTVAITLIRHAAYDFSFRDVYRVLHPYQRNHVNYAASIGIFIPFVVFAIFRYAKNTFVRNFLVASLLLLLVGVYLSYTRAAYVALLIAAGSYVIIRLGWMKYLVPLGLALVFGGLIFMVSDNRFMELAPNYDRTISHEDFDNLIEATYKLEDISTMERVYRWVAGAYLSVAHPGMGVGPGNFVNFYRSYTLDAFRTYVSVNEEGSGIHSYYLMTLVEQGIPGLFFLLLLIAGSLIIGERIYHRTADPEQRALIMAALLSLIVIDSFLIINDLLETDKVGPFFFMNLAIMVAADLRSSASLDRSRAGKSGH